MFWISFSTLPPSLNIISICSSLTLKRHLLKWHLTLFEEHFLEVPLRARLGTPKPYNSRYVKPSEHFQTSLPLSIAIPPTSYRGLSGPSGPSVPGSVPESVPKSEGVRRSVPRGVPKAIRAPGSRVSKKCPESVSGVWAGGMELQVSEPTDFLRDLLGKNLSLSGSVDFRDLPLDFGL